GKKYYPFCFPLRRYDLLQFGLERAQSIVRADLLLERLVHMTLDRIREGCVLGRNRARQRILQDGLEFAEEGLFGQYLRVVIDALQSSSPRRVDRTFSLGIGLQHVFDKLPGLVCARGKGINREVPAADSGMAGCVGPAIGQGSDIKLVGNFGLSGIIAKSISVGPVAHKGRVAILPGYTGRIFHVRGNGIWRDSPYPAYHHGKSLLGLGAIDGDFGGIVRIEDRATKAVQHLDKVAHQSLILRPLPDIAILDFARRHALRHIGQVIPGRRQILDQIFAIIEQADIRSIWRGPDLALVRTRLDWSRKIFAALAGRPLAIGDRLCPLAGGELCRIDNIYGHHIDAAVARSQHIVILSEHVIGAGWPLQPGNMNAILFANSLIEGIRQGAVRVRSVILTLPDNVSSATSTTTTATAGFEQRASDSAAQANGSSSLKKSTTGHTACTDFDNDFV